MLRLVCKLRTRHTSPKTTWGGDHCRSRSATVHGPPTSPCQEPQSNTQMATARAVLGSASSGQFANQGWLPPVPGLGLLIQVYGTRSSEMLLVWVPQTFEEP